MAGELKLEGFDELELAFRHLETELPKDALRKAVKGGADKVLQAARSAAPELTGALKGGLKLHKERSRVTGKVVYDVYPDPAKNDIFQKPIKNPQTSRSSYAYYPASQEYGFLRRPPDDTLNRIETAFYKREREKREADPLHYRFKSITKREVRTVGPKTKVPGKHYMLTGAELAGEAAKQSIVDDLLAAIYEELGG